MKKAIVICSMITASVIMVNCSPKTAKTTATTTETKATTTPSVATTATAAQLETGKSIYNAKCGTCHGLKDPTKYTQESWTHIMKSMIPKAKLNEADGNLVTAYVMANAKPQ